MPRKKRRTAIIALSFAFAIAILFFVSLGLWTDESSMIDWLKYLTVKEGREIADTGAELGDTIEDNNPGISAGAEFMRETNQDNW